MPKVSGSSTEMVASGPMPGKTPTMLPSINTWNVCEDAWTLPRWAALKLMVNVPVGDIKLWLMLPTA